MNVKNKRRKPKTLKPRVNPTRCGVPELICIEKQVVGQIPEKEGMSPEWKTKWWMVTAVYVWAAYNRQKVVEVFRQSDG